MILDRDRIFARLQTCWREGLGLLATGALIYALGQRYSTASENDRLSIAMFSVVLIWIACFVLCYGTQTFRAGRFPVLFLFLMVPFPDFFLNRVVFWLQTASAEVSYVVFEALGVPVLRTGFVFALPGVTIVVSEECSGIRSSLIMTIISLVAGHLYLQTAWRKVVLTVVTLPMLIVKNGIRIVTLTLLSVYVDPSFLTGNLHQRGGVVFFVIALAILAPILWFLKKSEPVPQGEL
jgi:exosortase